MRRRGKVDACREATRDPGVAGGAFSLSQPRPHAPRSSTLHRHSHNPIVRLIVHCGDVLFSPCYSRRSSAIFESHSRPLRHPRIQRPLNGLDSTCRQHASQQPVLIFTGPLFAFSCTTFSSLYLHHATRNPRLLPQAAGKGGR